MAVVQESISNVCLKFWELLLFSTKDEKRLLETNTANKQKNCESLIFVGESERHLRTNPRPGLTRATDRRRTYLIEPLLHQLPAVPALHQGALGRYRSGSEGEEALRRAVAQQAQQSV